MLIFMCITGNIVIQMYKNVAKVIHDARGNGHFHDRLYWKALFAGQHEMRGTHACPRYC